MVYQNFLARFELLLKKNSYLITNTLSNIFTMRLIGNKTHGDLAEIGIVEFINQFMYDYQGRHVGKDKYRAKEHEEDIEIWSELNEEDKFLISLKAYGDGPLQLSTDSSFSMFSYLQSFKIDDISDVAKIKEVVNSNVFKNFDQIHVLPLIYNETRKECNIMIFDYEAALKNTSRIILVSKGETFDKETQSLITDASRKKRKHPIYMFLNERGEYICEVRYGNATANALQRGLWTHTKNALQYFHSVTGGWIKYEHNHILVKLFSLALNSSSVGHAEANKILQHDIDTLKQNARTTI